MEGELAQLAALVDQKALTLYRHVNELQKRGLVQQRGRWRALLPHAIANRLARYALDAIPRELIEQKLVTGQERMLRSFSRRLGYLHESETAVKIVHTWLSTGGLLGDLCQFSPLLFDVFCNVAPVDPSAVLEAIKRAIKGSRSAEVLAPVNAFRSRLVRLVRSIAYDKEFFEDCLDVLVAFARAEPEDNKNDSTRSVISSLFMIRFSGTHASIQQRTEWIKQAIGSNDKQLQAIGLDALSSSLESHYFSSNYDFEFGARGRDYGAAPQGKAAREWFETFIQLITEVADGNGPMAEYARDILAQHFRSLWTIAGMADALEAAVGPLLDTGWEQGWLAIRQTIRLDGKGLPADILARLQELEARARPQTLVARVKAIVLNNHSDCADFTNEEDVSKGYERAEQAARELGELVAADQATFKTLLPLVMTKKQGRQWIFGTGLAAKTNSLEDCWGALVDVFESTPEDQQNINVLRGFLSVAFDRDRDLFNQILDEAMARVSLAKWVPELQLSAPLDDRGCLRLLTSMDNPAVPASAFGYRSLGRATHTVEDERLAQVLQRLSIKPDGLGVTIDILYMHIYDNPNPTGARLNEVARNLIANALLAKNIDRHEHKLADVVEKFLVGPDAETSAHQVLTAVRDGLENHTLSRYDLNEILAVLFEAHPSIALNLLVGDESDDDAYSRRHALAGGRRSSALSRISIEALLAWCREGSSERWIHIAPIVPAFETREEQSSLRWSKQVLALLQHSPEPVLVAEQLIDHIIPKSWSGSRAETIRQRLPLLDQLADILGSEHADQVTDWKNDIGEQIKREADREREQHRNFNETFE